MYKLSRWLTAVAFVAIASSSFAQAGSVASLQQTLVGRFPLTKVTADRSDVVTAGTILVLQKDGLLVYPASLAAAPINTYKNGKLSQGFGDSLKVDMIDGLGHPGGSAGIPKKTLVTGEKFWLIATEVQKDRVLLGIETEPYDDGRYFGVIKIQFPKGSLPSGDDLFRMIAEVVTAQPPAPASDNQQVASASSQQPPPASTATEAALAPIAPPPPPPDAPPPAPKTIALGQTRDQVIAIFGQPQKVAHLGPKEIDTYPDMKVTFANGKVADVQ